MSRVLVVGAGPTGVSAARELSERAAAEGTPLDLLVADPAEPGPGLAFSTPLDVHLLNVRAGSMTLRPGRRDDFDRWRRAHPERWRGLLGAPETGLDEFAPRRVFGAYAAGVFDDLLTAAPPGVRVRHHPDEVVSVRPTGDGRWRAVFAAGDATVADRVVLAVGHLPPDRHGLPEHPGVVGDPWRGVGGIGPAARVGVVGTRLTGIDVALELRAGGHHGPIVLASRGGLLPSIKGPSPDRPLHVLPDLLDRTTGRLTLGELGRAVADEIELAEGRTVDWTAELSRPATTATALRDELAVVASGTVRPWQGVLTAIIPLVPRMWQVLDDDGRHAFLTAYLGAWATRMAAFPAVSGHRILTMLDDGGLRVVSGLQRVRPDRLPVLCTTGGDVEVDVVVNATGPGFGRGALDSRPLTRGLLADGTAVAHPHGGLDVDDHTFEVRGPDGRIATGLHLVGDLTRGVRLATNDVGNTVRQCVLLAERTAGGQAPRIRNGSSAAARRTGSPF